MYPREDRVLRARVVNVLGINGGDRSKEFAESKKLKPFDVRIDFVGVW